jgi:hypothetical protein
MDFGVCKDNPRASGILDGVFCATVVTSNTADCPREMLAMERGFDVLDRKGLEVEVI